MESSPVFAKQKQMSSGRPDVMYLLPHFYGTTNHMISIATAGTDEFIDITSAVPSDFSDEFGEFAGTLMNQVYLYLYLHHIAQNRGI